MTEQNAMTHHAECKSYCYMANSCKANVTADMTLACKSAAEDARDVASLSSSSMFFKLPLLMLNRRCFNQLEDFCFPAGLLLACSVWPETVAAAGAAAPSEASLRAPVDADNPRRRCLAACTWHWLQPFVLESSPGKDLWTSKMLWTGITTLHVGQMPAHACSCSFGVVFARCVTCWPINKLKQLQVCVELMLLMRASGIYVAHTECGYDSLVIQGCLQCTTSKTAFNPSTCSNSSKDSCLPCMMSVTLPDAGDVGSSGDVGPSSPSRTYN